MTVDSAAPADATPQPAPTRRTGAIRRWARRGLARWRPILLTLLLIATLGNAARIFYFDYNPDLQTDRTAAQQVIRAAGDGAVALLSYSPETLDRDFANAKSRLTEDYLAYYQRFADQVVEPSAQRGQVTTTASVVKAAVSELHPNSAVVLVFIRQKTTSRAKPEPVVTSSSLKVTMAKVKGSWLIDKFDVM
ncbi:MULTISPECIES: twin-arginine translocation pathway signal [unclassified Mycobacterium]|uniref:twin-arginine translocation pathway signal n=1 Tax=unclassified Mycobacterium TaxID=2642494 RepID=UPI000AC0DF9D|nr:MULTISPECIES: twin-arginine translocation pathway signal [unclassified Mycobacterium]